MSVPFDQLRVGVGVCALVLAVNLASMVLARRPGEAHWVRATLGADVAILMLVVWLFAFDGTSALWALLIVAVLEAAYLGRLRGALATWAACAVGYWARDVFADRVYGIEFLAESVSYRMGIVLLVAVTAGYMSRDLAREAESHRAARSEAERRADVLALIASSGKSMTSGDSNQLLTSVVDGALSAGFDAAAICMFDEAAGVWRPTHTRNVPFDYLSAPGPIHTGMAGQVRATNSRVVIEDYALLENGVPAFRDRGFGAVVGVPVHAGGELAAALIGGWYRGRPVDPHSIEALEMLGQQAGAAIGQLRFVDELRHQSRHDSLTGLPNQVLFEDRVDQALVRRRRGGPDLAVGVVDIDHFKRINDSLGHAAGNELIRQVAARLRNLLAAEDTVARLGGDEFTLLLMARGGEDEVLKCGQRILDALKEPFVLEGQTVFLTASIGLAVCPADGMTFAKLLRNADFAMYRIKRRGRNGVTLHRGAQDGPRGARLTLEAELHRAVDAGELEVVYQPLVSLPDRKLNGVEALVRWRHPEKGLLGPLDFLPIAAETGLLASIDILVLRTACRQARAWAEVGDFSIPVAVNVSSQLLADPHFRQRVIGILDETGIPPGMLELEVSEQIASVQLAEGAALLDDLRSRGVRISIDDFGTGWSALHRLHDLKADRLKIDRSFVAQMEEGGPGAPVVSAALAMAHGLGLEVVAEGVETLDQLDHLAELGCDLVQGYHLSPPVPPLAIPGLVNLALGGSRAA